MLSPGDTDYPSIMRAERAANRRALLKSKRTRTIDLHTTDPLPELGEESQDQGVKPQPLLLQQAREENLRLRKELETYRERVNLLDREIETIHQAQQQELAQYQQYIRDMVEERNQLQRRYQQLEEHHRELADTLQASVEEAASKTIQDALATLAQNPTSPPTLLYDVMKALEGQLKQTADHYTAEALILLRQAQEKADLLDKEIAQAHQEFADERASLQQLKQTLNEQAQQRTQAERTRLQSRWTYGLTFISLVFFTLMALLELVMNRLQFPFALTLLLPLLICLALSYYFARQFASGRFPLSPQSKAARSGKHEKKAETKTSTP
jgi:chromosome segregation ATPase